MVKIEVQNYTTKKHTEVKMSKMTAVEWLAVEYTQLIKINNLWAEKENHSQENVKEI
jgi:hypothetical protein